MKYHMTTHTLLTHFKLAQPPDNPKTKIRMIEIAPLN